MVSLDHFLHQAAHLGEFRHLRLDHGYHLHRRGYGSLYCLHTRFPLVASACLAPVSILSGVGQVLLFLGCAKTPLLSMVQVAGLLGVSAAAFYGILTPLSVLVFPVLHELGDCPVFLATRVASQHAFRHSLVAEVAVFFKPAAVCLFHEVLAWFVAFVLC